MNMNISSSPRGINEETEFCDLTFNILPEIVFKVNFFTSTRFGQIGIRKHHQNLITEELNITLYHIHLLFYPRFTVLWLNDGCSHIIFVTLYFY